MSMASFDAKYTRWPINCAGQSALIQKSSAPSPVYSVWDPRAGSVRADDKAWSLQVFCPGSQNHLRKYRPPSQRERCPRCAHRAGSNIGLVMEGPFAPSSGQNDRLQDGQGVILPVRPTCAWISMILVSFCSEGIYMPEPSAGISPFRPCALLSQMNPILMTAPSCQRANVHAVVRYFRWPR